MRSAVTSRLRPRGQGRDYPTISALRDLDARAGSSLANLVYRSLLSFIRLIFRSQVSLPRVSPLEASLPETSLPQVSPVEVLALAGLVA